MTRYAVRYVREEEQPESQWTLADGSVLARTDDLRFALETALGFMQDCDPHEAAEIVDDAGRVYRPDHGDSLEYARFA